MMKLQYLTYYLFGLSLAGCSQHFVQSPQKTEQIQDHTVHAVSAIYENSGFDFKGDLRFDVQQNTPAFKKNPELNQELKNKLNHYLSIQQINLSAEQRQQLELALLQEQLQNGKQKWSRLLTTGFNFLQDFQVNYQGGVDYRDQVAGMNLTARYQTPSLQMQLSYPLIVDLKQAKFYTNVFAFMPFLAAPEQRDQLMYFDLSKFKGQFNRLDMRLLVDYLKQSNALPYILATPEQLTHVSVSAAERQQGVVEKVQLHTSLEEYVAQSLSYSTVNSAYLTQHLLSEKPATTEEAKQVDLNRMTLQEQADWAYALWKDHAAVETENSGAANIKDQESVTAHDGAEDVAEVDHPIAAAAENEPTDAEDRATTATSAEPAEDQINLAVESDSVELSHKQCVALQKQAKSASIGQYQTCLDEGVDLFASQTQDDQLAEQLAKTGTNVFKVVELFKGQSTEKFVSATDFKTQWQAKQLQIQALLANVEQRNPLVIEVSIDRQGRAVTTNYQAQLKADSINKTLHIRSNNQWSNYGHPKNIDREGMRKAKSFDEAAQGTVLQEKAEQFKRLFGQHSWDEQIQQLANQAYAQNHSYVKTYQLVYGMLLSLKYPQIMQHYSAQDIQEIALVMAYYDGQENGSYTPKGQELARIKQLIKKHQLNARTFYKVDATPIVKKAQRQAGVSKQWAIIQKSYSSSESRFAKLYEVSYLTAHNTEQATNDLKRLANRLGKFYVQSRQKPLNLSSIQQVSSTEYLYMDQDVFKSVYVQILQSSKQK
ncbi:hypothetical protein C9426_08100 [Serratia sp. S1B]|nr:hypothetical protein C9426_08100 [Serratia sp. S1B]